MSIGLFFCIEDFDWFQLEEKVRLMADKIQQQEHRLKTSMHEAGVVPSIDAELQRRLDVLSQVLTISCVFSVCPKHDAALLHHM